MGTLHEDLHRMRNFRGESCRKNQNVHFMFNNFFSKNRAVCDMGKYGRARQVTDDNIVWCVCMLDT